MTFPIIATTTTRKWNGLSRCLPQSNGAPSSIVPRSIMAQDSALGCYLSEEDEIQKRLFVWFGHERCALTHPVVSSVIAAYWQRADANFSR